MEKRAWPKRDQVIEGYLEFREEFKKLVADFVFNVVLGANQECVKVAHKYDQEFCTAIDGLGVELGAFDYLTSAKRQLDHAFVNKNKVE